MKQPASFTAMNPLLHSLNRLTPLIASMALATWSFQSTAAPLQVSFHLSAPPSAVALQFDVGFTLPGVSAVSPHIQGAGPHQIDCQSQSNGKTRFIIFSSTNTPIAQTGTFGVTLDLDHAALQDGIMIVSGVVASTEAGGSLSASPGAKPIALYGYPTSHTKAAVGGGVPVGVEVVDLDGSITGVLFMLNGMPVDSDDSRPYTSSITSASPGEFLFTAYAQDNVGNSITTAAVTLQYIDPVSLVTYSAFQAAWLGGTGDFAADPFHTGIPNGLAWALGVDPRNPDRSHMPAHFIEDNAGGKFLVYRARVLANGVVPQILSSTTLGAGSWTPIPPAQLTDFLEGGGWRLIEARIPITSSVPRRFVQLKVENP